MSFINKLLFILFLFCFTLDSEGQNMPNVCFEPNADYSIISSDILIGADEINCEINRLREIKLGSPLDNAKIYFSVNENFSFDSGVSGEPISDTRGVTNYFLKGVTWVVLEGQISNQKVVACKKYEFLERAEIKVSANLCEKPTVNLQLENPFLYESYEINWGDGIIQKLNRPNLIRHTYVDNFSEITVRGFFERNGEEVCFSNNVQISKDVPQATFLTHLKGLADSSEIHLKYLGNSQINYRIESTSEKSNFGIWEEVSNAQANEGTIIGLNPNEKQCFRLATNDACGETHYSKNILCNTVIEREVLTSHSMKVSWSIPQNPLDLPVKQLLSKMEGDQLKIVDLPINLDNKNYIDDDVNCGKNYFYKVKFTYPEVDFEGTLTAVEIESPFIIKKISDTKLDSPPPYMASVTNLNQSLKFEILGIPNSDKVLLSNINYYHSKDNNSYFLKESSKSFHYIENENEGCFKYDYEDICGVQTALSEPFCPIVLALSNTNLDLMWTSFKASQFLYNPLTTVIYNLQYWSPEINDFETINQLSDVNLFTPNMDILTTDQPNLKFRIQMVQDVLIPTDEIVTLTLNSNTVEVIRKPKFFVPSAFTPNGDGSSNTETFKIGSKFVKGGSYKILDRYGSQVFFGETLEDEWSGFNFPEGMYYYIINSEGFDGHPILLQGAVYLLR